MKNEEQLSSKTQDISTDIEIPELVLKKNNGLEIVWQCIFIIFLLLMFSFCSYELFMFIFKIIFTGTKSTDLKIFFMVMLFILFCVLLFVWLLYSNITQIIAENFSIKLYKDFFIFESILINKKVIYKDIKEAYVIDRSTEKKSLFSLIQYRKNKNTRYRYRYNYVLKIKRKKGISLFVCLNVLDKKEDQMLRKLLKQKLEKKIREKSGIWE